jgi:hypothetical protein
MNRKYTPLLIIFFIALVILMLTSCEDRVQVSTKPDPHRMELDNSSKYYDQNYNVYTLEGCEYIVVGVGKMQWGSHKGNCSNPIHKTQRYTQWEH